MPAALDGALDRSESPPEAAVVAAPAARCRECGTASSPGLRFCGGCGALVGTGPRAGPGAPDDGPSTAAAAGRPTAVGVRGTGRGARWRRALPAAAAAAALAVAVVVAEPDRPPEGTWGRADRPPDLVAATPLPVGDLALAWQLAPAAAGPPSLAARDVLEPVVVAAEDELVAVGRLVLDVGAGEVVGRVPFGLSVGDGRVLLGDGADLETWDVRSGARVAAVRVAEVGQRESLSVRDVFADGDVLATVCCRGRPYRTLRFVRVAPTGEAVPLPLAPGTNVVDVHGDDLVAITDAGTVRWVDLRTGDVVADVGSSTGDGGPLVDVGDHVVRAVDDRLLALDTVGRLRSLRVGPAAAPLVDLAVLGEADGRLVVAGRDAEGSTRRRLVALPAPPWTDPRVVDPDDVTTVFAPTPTPRDFPVAVDGTPGIRRPGDAAVVGDVVVVHDAPARLLRAVDLAGRTRWTRPAHDRVALAAALDHVLVVTPVRGGSRVDLLTADRGAVVWSRTAEPETEDRVVGVHDGDFVLAGRDTRIDARTGRPRAAGGTFPGRPLGIVPAPDGPGTAVLFEQRGRDRLTVTAGDLVVAVGRDVAVPAVHGLTGGTLIASHTISDSGVVRGRLELVRPDGATTVVDDIDGMATIRFGRLVAEPAVRRDGDAVLLDPATGAPAVVVTGASGLDRVADDRLVALGRLDWWLVDAADGRRVGPVVDLPLGQPVVGDGLLATTGVDGTITVVEARDASTRWRRPGPPAPTVAAFAGDQLLVGTHDGRVVAFDGRGERTDELVVGEGPVQSLAWADGTLLVTVDGRHRGFREDGTGILPGEVDLP